MANQTLSRTRKLAFALGAAALLVEIGALYAVSHAKAPAGQFLAGRPNCAAPAPAPEFIFWRPSEESL